MATANLDRVGGRVCWTIGARTDTFEFEVDDDRYSKLEIAHAILEAESEIVHDMVDSYHPQRVAFLTWQDVAEGGNVPHHIGQVAGVRIRPYQNAPWVTAQLTNGSNIGLWRDNHNNAYDPIDHDIEGSTLAGYYDLSNGVLNFTGYNAQVQVARYTPDNGDGTGGDYGSLQLDSQWESLIHDGAVTKLVKDGADSTTFSHFASRYMAGREALRNGIRQRPEIDDEQRNG